MTPDTLPIDIRLKGVGRIHRASGTLDPVVRRRIVRAVKDVHQDGRLDICRALQDGDVSFLQFLDCFTRKSLHELPIGAAMPLVSVAMKSWIEDSRPDYSTNHIGAMETSRRYFERENAGARIADLPDLLEDLRKSLGKKYARSFNLARAHALAFLRATLKRSHPIYLAVLAVEVRPEKKKKLKPHLTVAALRGWFPNPDATTKEGKVDRIVWAMVTTGMHQKEYWGSWETQADRIHIAGTKRGGRVRDVPLVRVPAPPPLSRDRFEKLFRLRMEGRVTPYDLRRTYMQWLESAGIPRTRRKMYMGHSAKDVSDLYERHEVTAFLVADAKTLGAYLGITPPDPSAGSNQQGTGTLGIVK